MRVVPIIKLIVLGCIALALTSCLGTPGKGRKARAGYRAAAPVIAALEKFHDDNSRYPTNLVELVPMYLSATNLLAQKHVEPLPSYSPPWERSATNRQEFVAPYDMFWYERDGDVYTLGFTYFGPGVSMCGYDSKTKTWHASCHY